MTTASHNPSETLPERRPWSFRDLAPEVWSSLAIAVMWLAVLFAALWGPALVVTNSSGTTSIPCAVFVALFAYLGTRVMARTSRSAREAPGDDEG
jgi:hypothetical protein